VLCEAEPRFSRRETLLEDPDRQRYGLALCHLAGLPSGTIYPILARLEQIDWVDSTWEDPALHEEAGRPRRRFYL
jgi:PadR family transcriptional regulator PadR